MILEIPDKIICCFLAIVIISVAITMNEILFAINICRFVNILECS